MLEKYVKKLPDSPDRSAKPIRDTVKLSGEDIGSANTFLAAMQMINYSSKRRKSRPNTSRIKAALGKAPNCNRKVVEDDHSSQDVDAVADTIAKRNSATGPGLMRI